MVKRFKMLRKNILVPRNIEGRKEKLRQDRIRLLSHEVIEGDLDIDDTFEAVPEEFIKIKEIRGELNLPVSTDYIPSWLKNIKIYKDFCCSGLGLISLENCPQYVGGDFYCNDNSLISLEGCPKYIGGDIWCYRNNKKLTLPEGVELKGKIYFRY